MNWPISANITMASRGASSLRAGHFARSPAPSRKRTWPTSCPPRASWNHSSWIRVTGTSKGARVGLVPAVLTLGLAEGLVVQSRVFHGTTLALFSIALEIRAPLRTGDTIAVAVEVAEVCPTSDGVRAKVATINTVIDQDNCIVVEYRPVRLVA